MGEESDKVTRIWQIVWLKEILQKWQPVPLGARDDDYGRTSIEDPAKASGIPPLVDKCLKSTCRQCDSDEESCQSPEPPPDVPKGCIPVYVGPEHRRFVIPMNYLSLPVFKLLLEKAEEEFGFNHKGALTLPCEIETFKYILQIMERHQKGLIDNEGTP